MAETSDIQNLLDFVDAPGLGYYEFRNMHSQPTPPPVYEPGQVPGALVVETTKTVTKTHSVVSETTHVAVEPEDVIVGTTPVAETTAAPAPQTWTQPLEGQSGVYGSMDLRGYGAITGGAGVVAAVTASTISSTESISTTGQIEPTAVIQATQVNSGRPGNVSIGDAAPVVAGGIATAASAVAGQANAVGDSISAKMESPLDAVKSTVSGAKESATTAVSAAANQAGESVDSATAVAESAVTEAARAKAHADITAVASAASAVKVADEPTRQPAPPSTDTEETSLADLFKRL